MGPEQAKQAVKNKTVHFSTRDCYHLSKGSMKGKLSKVKSYVSSAPLNILCYIHTKGKTLLCNSTILLFYFDKSIVHCRQLCHLLIKLIPVDDTLKLCKTNWLIMFCTIFSQTCLCRKIVTVLAWDFLFSLRN